MPPPPSSDSNRREFLRDALRCTALAGIAGLVGSAAYQAAVNGAACTRARFCEQCLQFPGCDKEQAAATRQAAERLRGTS